MIMMYCDIIVLLGLNGANSADNNTRCNFVNDNHDIFIDLMLKILYILYLIIMNRRGTE